VIAPGKTHSVKKFVEIAFNRVDRVWTDFVVVDKKFYRPTEINELRGDASKAKKKWAGNRQFLVRILLK
jgi:GDPmannose 4,6-dehydratase